MKYAIIENGVVTNIAVSSRPLAANWAAIPVGCPVAIGDRYEAGVFYSPDGLMRTPPELAAAINAIMGGVADA